MADKVMEQYDPRHALVFYRHVSGGGGLDIHQGVYRSPSDSVYEASKEMNNRLITCMDWTYPVTEESMILDLGAGHGALSHEMAKKFGCKVVAVNISPAQNKINEDEAEKLGVGSHVEVVLANFDDGLPGDWANKFTHVVSCEAVCHAANRPKLFAEVKRCLVPGGAFVFIDIMGADGADEEALKDFTALNAVVKMGRPLEYLTLLRESGFINAGFNDLSAHLRYSFQSLLDQCNNKKSVMMADGVDEAYIDKWMEAVTSRLSVQKTHALFAWGIFSARIEGPVY